MAEGRTITVCIGWHWLEALVTFEQCWNCRMYFRPRRLTDIKAVNGRYCRSCAKMLDRQIEPHEMDYAEEQHAEQIDPGRDANGRSQLRSTARDSVTDQGDRSPEADAGGSWPGARRYRERLGRTLLEHRAKARARQFTDTQ